MGPDIESLKTPADIITADSASGELCGEVHHKASVKHRIQEFLWDSWDRSPEERKFLSKIDFFIL